MKETPKIRSPLVQLRKALTAVSSPIDTSTMPTVHLLDYAAGNIRSLVNAIEKLGWQVEWIKSPDDVAKAEVKIPVQKSQTCH